MKKWDVIIIGSGISALAAAWALANRGKKILICERHKKGGGMCHEFSRSGGAQGKYFFSAGVHYIGQVQKGAFSWRLFHWTTGGQLEWDYLPPHYDVFHFPHFQAQAHQDLKIYAQELSAQFPSEAPAIRRYFRQRKTAALGVGLFQMGHRLSPLWRRIVQWFCQKILAVGFFTTQEYLNRHFKDPRLRAILSAQWGDYGTLPALSPFGYSAIVGQHFQQGISHPRGGSGEIFALIAPRLEQLGVEICLNCPVQEILVENNQAVGVRYTNGPDGLQQIAYGEKVLSTVGIFNTYYRLLPSHLLSPTIGQELAKLTPAPSAVILYLGTQVPWEQSIPGFTGANQWFFPYLDHQASHSQTRAGEGVLFLAFNRGNLASGRLPTAQAIVFCGPEALPEFAPWQQEGPAARKADPNYQQLKQEISERILARLTEKFPGLAASITYQELATPFSFEKYQNAYQGAFYGVRGDQAKLHSPLTSPRTFVKNLYLGGQDLLSPGIVGALMGGIQAAGQILGPLGLWRILRSIFSS